MNKQFLSLLLLLPATAFSAGVPVANVLKAAFSNAAETVASKATEYAGALYFAGVGTTAVGINALTAKKASEVVASEVVASEVVASEVVPKTSRLAFVYNAYAALKDSANLAVRKATPYVTGTNAVIAATAAGLGYGSYKLASKHINQDTKTGKGITYVAPVATAAATAGAGYYFHNGIAKLGTDKVAPWASWAGNGLVNAGKTVLNSALNHKYVTAGLGVVTLLGAGLYFDVKVSGFGGSNQQQPLSLENLQDAKKQLEVAYARVTSEEVITHKAQGHILYGLCAQTPEQVKKQLDEVTALIAAYTKTA